MFDCMPEIYASKISCHHYTMSHYDDNNDDRKFYMRKYEAIFAIFYVRFVSSLQWRSNDSSVRINRLEIMSSISQKRLEIEARFQWTTNRYSIRRIEWSRGWWRHVTKKGQRSWSQYIWGPLSSERLETVLVPTEDPYIGNNRKQLQYITLITAIVYCFTHRKQQKW